MKCFLVTLALLVSIPALAQSKDSKPASKPEIKPAPALSTAERIAFQACEKSKQDAQKQFSDAQQQELSVLREFGEEHPGFTVNQQTFQVEAVPAPKK